jgi:hypothetical protein
MTVTAALIAIVWSGFILWTVRKFWMRHSDAADEKYFIEGRLWTALGTVAFAFAASATLPFPGLPYWLDVVYLLLLTFPIATVVGHYYGRCIKAISERKSRK